jgi:uncharacterized protein (TIGR02145 family)
MKNILFVLLLFSFHKIKSQTAGPGVADIDGNFYNTVIIGNQECMSENLRTTKYCNGDILPINNNWPTGDWGNLTVGAWNYAPDPNPNGKFYNWYAASDTRNICPCDWHVPTDSEWTILENYLIDNGFNYDGTTTGNKIAKAMASQSNFWANGMNNVGAVGNNLLLNNSSGFDALPIGSTLYQYGYGGEEYAFWWTSNEWNIDNTYAIWRGLSYQDNYLWSGAPDIGGKDVGFSIRCVKTDPLNINSQSKSSFNIYPNPTNNFVNITSQDLPCEYIIYENSGKKLNSGIINSENSSINVSELQSGIYFITISTETKSKTQKFIKL